MISRLICLWRFVSVKPIFLSKSDASDLHLAAVCITGYCALKKTDDDFVSPSRQCFIVAICRPIPKPSSRFFEVIWKKCSKFRIDQVFFVPPHSATTCLHARLFTLVFVRIHITLTQFWAHDKKINTIACWQCPCWLDNWQHHSAFNDHHPLAHCW